MAKEGVGRLPPFYNNVVTPGGICDINRQNLTYVYSESVFRTGCLFFYSRTLPFNTRKRLHSVLTLGLGL